MSPPPAIVSLVPSALEFSRSSTSEPPNSRADMLTRVGEIVKSSLALIVRDIDDNNLCPAQVLRSLGAAGAYEAHIPSVNGSGLDLPAAIDAMALAGKECLSTAFCMWCQSALAWYVENTENTALKARFAPLVASGTLTSGSARAVRRMAVTTAHARADCRARFGLNGIA